MTQTLLILGARSDMARAIAHRFAAAGWRLQLAARDARSLEADVSDLQLRHGVEASAHEFDALAIDRHRAFAAGLPILPDVVVSCVGFMGEQADNEANEAEAAVVMRSNFEGPALALAAFASLFAARRSGTLVGISSVAGERGRASNYVYGSAKAGFTAFLSGLRNRLAQDNVTVITVIPGFVNTAMTQHLKLPARLTAEPVEVGEAVFRAVANNTDVIYVRRIWRLVMLVIRNIPERIFKRLKL